MPHSKFVKFMMDSKDQQKNNLVSSIQDNQQDNFRDVQQKAHVVAQKIQEDTQDNTEKKSEVPNLSTHTMDHNIEKLDTVNLGIDTFVRGVCHLFSYAFNSTNN